MLLLALDTSGTGVTVALHDGQRVIAQRSSAVERRHAELLTPAIAAVLADAGVGRGELTDLAVGIGPGPFTGLRAGLVTARVLGLVWQLPVHGVCSLDALAGQVLAAGAVPAGGRFRVATDARRREVYWAGYAVQGDGPAALARRLSGPEVSAPDQLPRDGQPVAGRGAQLYPQVLGPAAPVPAAPLDVTGAGVAELAVRRILAGEPDDGLDPLYLRRPDAAPPGPRKRVLR